MAGSIAGELIRGDMKPKVPKWVDIDPSQEAGAAITGNIRNLPHAAQLGEGVNTANAKQYLSVLNTLGLGGMNSKVIENIQRMLSGKLPSDVESYISRKAAERGIAHGTSGSEFDEYGALRDLGLTSLEVTNKGLDAASRWIAQSSGAVPRFDFTSMFVSPAQQISSTQFNRTMRFNRDWMQNQIDVMPDAWQRALANLFDNIEETGQSVLGAYAGGMVGGGGGGMGGKMGGGGGGGNYQPQYTDLAAGEAALRGY